MLLRLGGWPQGPSIPAIIDSRTIQSTPSSTGTGYDGAGACSELSHSGKIQHMENRQTLPIRCQRQEWAFVAPYHTLFPWTPGQRKHSLREVFNANRYSWCAVVARVAHAAQ